MFSVTRSGLLLQRILLATMLTIEHQGSRITVDAMLSIKYKRAKLEVIKSVTMIL